MPLTLRHWSCLKIESSLERMRLNKPGETEQRRTAHLALSKVPHKRMKFECEDHALVERDPAYIHLVISYQQGRTSPPGYRKNFRRAAAQIVKTGPVRLVSF